ncbi:hypothetical protein [Agrobacterium larrymoorei]|uniref:Uncharacterized protein n=1 Tax=Agrobacterium larrymoorei TaxID=160699 RepID=A0ABU0UQ11_9HYPH|nr:hypothetical protein [Agrobacterium larrymoorei]MDQ1187029.1 hypothetical protein [Agrobacterium larrymoorei]
MAYDWSGNDIKQRHYDRLIVVALLAIVSIAVTAPFMLRFETQTPNGGRIETRSRVVMEDMRSIQLARS